MGNDAMHATESVQKLIAKATRLADGRPIKEIHVLLGELTGLTPTRYRPCSTLSGTARWRPKRFCMSARNQVAPCA